VSSARASLLRILAVALPCVAAATLALRAGASPPDLLCLAPAVALALLFATRRYPGERTLLALRARRSERPRRHAACAGTQPRVRRAARPRGGALLAFGLAVRPPPPVLTH
jgi:hypothetical protein